MTIDRRAGSILWQSTSLAVGNVTAKIEPPKGAVQLLGFCDLHLFVAEQPLLQLNRTAIKLIRGRLHFDPQPIEGKGEKVGVFFPTWRPSTAEARVVLTELLKLCPEIQHLVAQAQTNPQQQGGAQ